MLANIRANISEWAVAKQYNLAWNLPWYPNELHPRRKNIPDVGDFEVRTVRTNTSIPFWDKDKDRIIFGTKILDDDSYSLVEVYGWFKAEQYMSVQYRDESINGWRVPTELLVQD